MPIGLIIIFSILPPRDRHQAPNKGLFFILIHRTDLIAAPLGEQKCGPPLGEQKKFSSWVDFRKICGTILIQPKKTTMTKEITLFYFLWGPCSLFYRVFLAKRGGKNEICNTSAHILDFNSRV